MHKIRVLLIHGAWCGPSHLNALIESLTSQGFPVTSLTLPGHAEGEDPSGYSLKDYVQAVKKDLDTNGPAILVGHSMGAFVAQMVATEDSRVLATVLVSPAGKPFGGFLFGALLLKRILHPHYWWGMITGNAVRCLDGDLRDLLLNKVEQGRREHEVRSFGPESGRALLQIALAQFCIWTKRQKLFGRVLTICGDTDKTTPAWLARMIAHSYGSEPLIVRDAGHMLFSEPCATRVAGHIARWIKKAVPQAVVSQAAK